MTTEQIKTKYCKKLARETLAILDEFFADEFNAAEFEDALFRLEMLYDREFVPVTRRGVHA